jgi:dienelactone hydrolase
MNLPQAGLERRSGLSFVSMKCLHHEIIQRMKKISPKLWLPVLACLLSANLLAEDNTISQKEQDWFANPPATVETRGDVPYLKPARAEKLDLYLPKNRPLGTLSPAVILIHGGAWTKGDKRQAREIEIGTTLAENGFVAASVNYDLTPNGKYPANLKDCKNAVRFLRTNSKMYGVDPDKIAVLGGSAGGHLALMVGYTGDDPSLAPQNPYPGVSDKVGAVVDMYGVSDIPNRKKTDAEGTPGELIGINELIQLMFGDAEAAKVASPINHISSQTPPTIILQGKKDKSVDRDQSISLHESLQKAGVQTQIILLEKAGHSFSFKYANAKNKKPLERDNGSDVIAFLKKALGVI